MLGNMAEPAKFRRDLVWNLASTAIFGVVGLLLYLLVGRFYGPATLGVFSQVVAVYLVLSQLAVGGLVFSLLHFTGSREREHAELGAVFGSGFLLVALQSTLVCLLAWALAPAFGRFLDSPEAGVGLRAIVPGLFCFALNKFLLFGLTGIEHLRAHAVAQGARWLLLLAALLVLMAAETPGAMLPAIFSIGEFLLLLPLLFYCWRAHPFQVARVWLKRHLAFSSRTALSSLLLDINTRIDLLVLGYFTTDAVVGIYSFAATLAEAVLHIATVVQTNVTPLLGRLEIADRATRVRQMVRLNLRKLVPVLALLAVVGTLVFPFFARLVTGQEEFAQGAAFFAVLAAGLVIASAYYPFHYVLNQWGYPSGFLAFNLLLVLTNLVLNLLLIPVVGPLGAAIATATAYVVSIVYLKALTYHFAGVSI